MHIIGIYHITVYFIYLYHIGIVSSHTSYVAVSEKGSGNKDENWVMQSRFVASQFTHGWHGHGPVGPPPNKAMASRIRAPPFRGGAVHLGERATSNKKFGQSQESNLGSFANMTTPQNHPSTRPPPIRYKKMATGFTSSKCKLSANKIATYTFFNNNSFIQTSVSLK